MVVLTETRLDRVPVPNRRTVEEVEFRRSNGKGNKEMVCVVEAESSDVIEVAAVQGVSEWATSNLKKLAKSKKFKGSEKELYCYEMFDEKTVVALLGLGAVRSADVSAEAYYQAGERLGKAVYSEDPSHLTLVFTAIKGDDGEVADESSACETQQCKNGACETQQCKNGACETQQCKNGACETQQCKKQSNNAARDGGAKSVSRASVRMFRLTAFLHRLLFCMVKNEEYVSKEKDSVRCLESIELLCEGVEETELVAVFNSARILALNSILAAALIDAPPNYCNCKTFAATVAKEAETRKHVTCSILDETKCAALNMGAFLAVAQGSRHGARLVHLVYAPPSSKATTQKIAVVGKGITMDTGGYSLKPAGAMLWMKQDMGGAALAVGSVLAAADLELEDVEVHCVVAVCENMVSSEAYRPGDIVTASNGMTIEVQNTDAEGRLVLADALVFAQQQIGSGGVVIDAATLTGACIVALGNEIAALYSNEAGLASAIKRSADLAGEAVWPMPLRQRYLARLKKSPYCDIANVKMGASDGGSIVAALFLQQFVLPDTRWAHLDIAPTAFNHDSSVAAGWGIASLITYFTLH